MPADLIEMWALTVGAVLVHVQAWIAALAIVSLIWRVWYGMRDKLELSEVVAVLNQINERLEKAVIFPKHEDGK